MQAIDAHELAVYIWEPNSPGMVGEKEGERERGGGGGEMKEKGNVRSEEYKNSLSLTMHHSKQALSKKCRCRHCKIQQSKCSLVPALMIYSVRHS